MTSISSLQTPFENHPFHAKSEPFDILQGKNLSGKIALVTGGYSGIGIETVRGLVNAGADVYVPARDIEKATAALAGILPKNKIGLMDLSDINSVRTYARHLSSEITKLDILINNAGVMACPEQKTTAGWEWQIGVNHFGHAALFQALIEHLRKADGSRVVALSSIGHRISGIRFDDMHFENSAYDKWVSYGQSKTACALLATGIAERYKDDGILSFSVHPGGIFTPLQRHLPTEEMTALGWLDKDGNIPPIVQERFKSPSQGATTSLWCATEPALENKAGVYCEDCNIAPSVSADDKGFVGVRPWAIDEEPTARLWDLTSNALSQK